MQLGLTKQYVLSDADAVPRKLTGPAVLMYESSILLCKRIALVLVYLVAH